MHESEMRGRAGSGRDIEVLLKDIMVEGVTQKSSGEKGGEKSCTNPETEKKGEYVCNN